MHGSDVLAAENAVRQVLEPAVDRDWSAQVPGLDFTTASVIAHAAEGALWYALDLWGGPGDDGAFELSVKAGAGNQRLLASLAGAARLCAASVDAAPIELRGFHPLGLTDASGFAAMACDEILVHGEDAARGLGLSLTPDPMLATRVLERLFSWQAGDHDPWQLLLWANGRLAIDGLPYQHRWRWQVAPAGPGLE